MLQTMEILGGVLLALFLVFAIAIDTLRPLGAFRYAYKNLTLNTKMSLTAEWNSAQAWERNWWMTYRNQHPNEITKNDFVSKMMFLHDGAPHASVLDIGCGPLSLLLRYPTKRGVGLDPIHYGD